MNIVIWGAAGFLGTNLTLSLMNDKNNNITLIDIDKSYFGHLKGVVSENVKIVESDFCEKTDFDTCLSGQDIVYHLVSTVSPSNSNIKVAEEIEANVLPTIKLLDSCVKCSVKKIVFISSGGTVYGVDAICPIEESSPLMPITSYGIQKVTIEKLLYLYGYLYGMDYRIIRLANPYGPYQRPNGKLGVVTTFTYQALKGETIKLFGNGSIVRDFIYVDDAINAIIKIANSESKHRVYNLGSGKGTTISEVISAICEVLNKDADVEYLPERNVDVPANYLDISRYEEEYGMLNPISLEDGVSRTAEFLKDYYDIERC